MTKTKRWEKFLQLEDFDTTTLDSMGTPHIQVDILFKVYLSVGLGKMFKEHKDELFEIGKMISKSRLWRHYPSDSKFGEQVGEILFQNLK